LVFTRTKHGADKVVKGLAKAAIAAEAIHGNKSQNHRERVLAAFRSGAVRTLVATDIAARGIDVDGISHVVNFDLPNIPETYVHRIGRTARAGADGIAISLVDGDEAAYLRDIEKLIRQTLPKEDRRSGDRRTHAERTGDTRTQRNAGADSRRAGAQHGPRHAGRGTPHRDDRDGAQRSNGRAHHHNGARTSHPAAAASHESIHGVAFMTRDGRKTRSYKHRRQQPSAQGRPQGVRNP
jgi:superfamily II DNA/RNA helicase